MALHHRQITGEGQRVDVSIHEAVAQCVDAVTWLWDMMKVVRHRGQGVGTNRNLRVTTIWSCKDGHVVWVWWFGLSGIWNRTFIDWMEEEGIDVSFSKEFDWSTFDYTTITQEVLDRLAEPTNEFFMKHTKAELLEGALKRRVMLYPVATTADMLEHPQLAARGYWVSVEHPELGTAITYPGAFAHMSELPPRISRRAPLIGEHNQEVYEKELGISREKFLILKQAGII